MLYGTVGVLITLIKVWLALRSVKYYTTFFTVNSFKRHAVLHLPCGFYISHTDFTFAHAALAYSMWHFSVAVGDPSQPPYTVKTIW